MKMDPNTKILITTEEVRHYCKCHNDYHSPDDDTPALINNIGNKYWMKHGMLHRETGPAVIYQNGHRLYYLDGIEVEKFEFVERYEMLYLKEYKGR